MLATNEQLRDRSLVTRRFCFHEKMLNLYEQSLNFLDRQG